MYKVLLQKISQTSIILLRIIMKKCFILLITLFLTSVHVFAADVSRLYRIKEADSDSVNKILAPYLKSRFPNMTKQHNGYILEDKQKGYYYVIIISEKDENCYLYYMSNNEDEDLRKDILKTLKNNDFKNKRVLDSSLKSYFYGEAYTNLAHSTASVNLRSKKDVSLPQTARPEAVNAKEINYDFSDEAQERFNSMHNSNVINLEVSDNDKQKVEINPKRNVIRLPQIGDSGTQSAYNPYTQQNLQPQIVQKPTNVLSGSVVYIPDGTSFTAALLSDISSESLVNNDRISAELDQDWSYNGQLIAPAGSILNGRAVDTKSASFAMGNGQIGLLFDEVMTPDGNLIPLKTNKVYIVGNNSRALNITKRVAGGAAAGLLLSAVSMLMGADPTHAIIYGMSLGAGGGAISAISAKGEEIQLIEGSQLQIMLTEPLTIQTYRQ